VPACNSICPVHWTSDRSPSPICRGCDNVTWLTWLTWITRHHRSVGGATMSHGSMAGTRVGGNHLIYYTGSKCNPKIVRERTLIDLEVRGVFFESKRNRLLGPLNGRWCYSRATEMTMGVDGPRSFEWSATRLTPAGRSKFGAGPSACPHGTLASPCGGSS
jgi:hypothetical protein